MKPKSAQKVWHGSPSRECYLLEYNKDTKNVLLIPVEVKRNKMRTAYWCPYSEVTKSE